MDSVGQGPHAPVPLPDADAGPVEASLVRGAPAPCGRTALRVAVNLGGPVPLVGADGRGEARRHDLVLLPDLPGGPAAVPPGHYLLLAAGRAGDYPQLCQAAGGDRPVVVRGDRMAGLLVVGLQAELARATPDAAVAAHLAGALLAHAERYLQAAAPAPARSPRLTPFKLRLVQELVDRRLDEPLTMSELAAAARMSRFHFCRAFKGSTGFSPHEYLMHRRVERCRRLLAETGMPLAEIALECGFSSQAHMTTCFRRLTGTTPNRYRQGPARLATAGAARLRGIAEAAGAGLAA